MRARVAVIYYSATGNVHALADSVAEGAQAAGAEVRLRHVEELASELMISQNHIGVGIGHESPKNRSPRFLTSTGPTGLRSGHQPDSGTSPLNSSNSSIKRASSGKRDGSQRRSPRPSPPHTAHTVVRSPPSSPSTTPSTTGECSFSRSVTRSTKSLRLAATLTVHRR
jgi:hypothetical protein